MKAHTNEANEDKSRPAANAQAQSKSGTSLTADSPQATAQRKLHEMANSSVQVKQLQVVQQMADNKPRNQAGQLQQTTVNTAAQPVQLLRNPLPYINRNEKKLADHNFTVNHLTESAEFTIAKAKERANSRGAKNTIIDMNAMRLQAELERMLKDPRAPNTEIDAKVGTSIEKPTVSEFEWVTATSNADPALQVLEGGKDNLKLQFNVNAAAPSKPGEDKNTPTVKVFHLEMAGLANDAAYLATKATEDVAKAAAQAELARMEAAHIARLAAKKERAKAKASAKAEPAKPAAGKKKKNGKKKNGKKKTAAVEPEDLAETPVSATTDETFDEEEATTPTAMGAGVPTVMEEYKERRSEEADTTDEEEEDEEAEATITTGEWLSQQARKGFTGIKSLFGR